MSPVPPQPLRGPQVVLDALRDEDSAALLRWINDRELVQLSAPFRPVGEADHAAWFAAVRAREHDVILAIRDAAAGDGLVGTCQLVGVDPVAGRAELRIRIGEPAAQGRGLGGEALALLLQHAFTDLELTRVELEVFATNARARRAYARAGFAETGVRAGGVEIEGVALDVVQMAIDRHRWAASVAERPSSSAR